MTRHYGEQAEAVEAQVLAEIDAHFETGAAFCRLITNRWLDLVVGHKVGAGNEGRFPVCVAGKR
jgi:hypothetical protein